MKCKLVDVFAERKLSGNGLTIFWDFDHLASDEMFSLTQEMRQFESIFVEKNTTKATYRARIYTMEEELDFAGHPLLGLAAHLHEEYGSNQIHEWVITLNNQNVVVTSRRTDDYFKATMIQSRPDFIKELDETEAKEIVTALSLKEMNLSGNPLEVISTGLPYLIVPLTTGLDKARICVNDFEEKLSKSGAKFVYVLDVNSLEGRTWDNQGSTEDIATGSAAGPAGAYLYKHNFVQGNTSFNISQGRFVGRPSNIETYLNVEDEQIYSVLVSGNVCKVADIIFA